MSTASLRVVAPVPWHRSWWLLAGAAWLAVCLCSLALGAVNVPLSGVVGALVGLLGWDLGWVEHDVHAMVVVSLRLPRVAMAMLIGAALSVSGVLVQGWFRNPLAEPSVLGVSGGATLAAASAIVFARGVLGTATVPLAAFGGGLVAVAVVHQLARARGKSDIATLLLAGLAITAITGAGTGLLVTVATDDQLRDITFWTLGSVGGTTWSTLAWGAPGLLLGLALAWPLHRSLDALLLGERTAGHLGVDVARVQLKIAVLVAWMVGLSVAASGMIAFVGLLAPHLVRFVVGPRHRVLLPATAVVGSTLLATADLCARTVAMPVELPIGVLTTLLGGPAFLAVLLRHGRS